MMILLYGSMPVSMIHRLWSNKPVQEVDWFVYVSQKQDVQWYVYMTGNMLSVVMILMASLIYVLYDLRKDKWRFAFGLLAFIVSGILEIFNYWFYAGWNDQFTYWQGLLILLSGIISLNNESNGTRKKVYRHGPAN